MKHLARLKNKFQHIVYLRRAETIIIASTMFKEQPAKRNLHKSFRFVITIAQIFGLFPVRGIWSDDVNALKFSWCSAGVVLSLPIIFGGWFCSYAHIRDMLLDKYDPYDMNGVVFNFSNATYYLLFIILAKDWPLLMREWSKVERDLEKYGWPKRLDFRLRLTSGIFLSLELLEHLTVQINKVIVAFQCKGSVQKSFEHFFATMSFSHIFQFVEYSHWKGIALQLINTYLAFCWTYVDLFIVLISSCLALRFRQITKTVKSMAENRVASIEKWQIVREDYNKLCKVCLLTDEKLSNIVVLSFITNFYFVIFHLFRSLNVRESTLESVYFAISFGLLILRTVCVCWYGGWVYEESRTPIHFLTSIPHTAYNIEVERFIDKIRFESVGMTGKQFFKITKGLILKLASAIVTYELVVIQFNGVSVTKVSIYSLCE